MKKYVEKDSLDTLLNNIKTKKSNNRLLILDLNLFTSFSEKNILKKINFMKKDSDGYYFKKDNYKYSFRLLSDSNILPHDKDILLDSDKRKENSITRSLRLVGSKTFNNSKILVASTNDKKITTLIKYFENNQNYIVDYSNNLIMPEEAYNKLFEPSILNELDEFDTYALWKIMEDLNFEIKIGYMLLFFNEIKKELAKKEEFKWLNYKYDSIGINAKNYSITADNIFRSDFDRKYYHSDSKRMIDDEINLFTLNPDVSTNHISNLKKDDYYYYEDSLITFSFRLLSDYIEDEKLLSKERFHLCHDKSFEILGLFKQDTEMSIYLVNGMIRADEVSYYYHTWIELEVGDDNLVIDYTRNLIISKDAYEKLLDAKVISRNDKSIFDELAKLLVNNNLNIRLFWIEYFGKELLNDLNKNDKILIKNKEH